MVSYVSEWSHLIAKFKFLELFIIKKGLKFMSNLFHIPLAPIELWIPILFLGEFIKI